MDSARIYDETRRRITALVSEAGDRIERPVPACPDWTVKDVVAHLAGLTADWRNLNLADYGSDEWTEAQVAFRRERDLVSLLAEWEDHTDAIRPMLDEPGAAGLPPYMPMMVITDIVAHEHDIRGALGVPGARDSEAVVVGLRSQIGGMRQHFGRVGLPALRIDAVGLRDWAVGTDEPVATLRGNLFDLFRATGGRRTMDEVRAMEWDGDPGTFLPHLLQPPYTWPSAPLHE
jgi:uncharacterized protein (TIGR03083 family)